MDLDGLVHFGPPIKCEPSWPILVDIQQRFQTMQNTLPIPN